MVVCTLVGGRTDCYGLQGSVVSGGLEHKFTRHVGRLSLVALMPVFIHELGPLIYGKW